MINEGAKILEEKIAQRASDIDVVWINGYGWPVYRGGPMFYADAIGAKTVAERLGAYQATGGDDYKPRPCSSGWRPSRPGGSRTSGARHARRDGASATRPWPKVLAGPDPGLLRRTRA